MSSFWQRTLTGAVFVAIIIGLIYAGQWPFFGLVLVVQALCLYEFGSAFKGQEEAPRLPLTVGMGTALFTLIGLYWYGVADAALLTLLQPAILFILLVGLYRRTTYSAITGPSVVILGIVYISFSFSALISIAELDGAYHPNLIMGCFVLIWASDTFAYLTGRQWGKTPLFPRHSPKKTWEGTLGGGVGAVAASIVLSEYIGIIPSWKWLGLAVIFVVFGILGDLIESMFKRTLGLKDSGNLLPGHGGFLDRFDSLLFASPWAAAFLYVT